MDIDRSVDPSLQQRKVTEVLVELVMRRNEVRADLDPEKLIDNNVTEGDGAVQLNEAARLVAEIAPTE